MNKKGYVIWLIYCLAPLVLIYAIELIPNLFGYTLGRYGYTKINSPHEFWVLQRDHLLLMAGLGIIIILLWLGVQWEEDRNRKKIYGSKSKKKIP